VEGKINLDQLRLGSASAADHRAVPLTPPKPRAGEHFLKGPVPWQWLMAAAQQRGKVLHVAITLWFLAGLNRRREVKLSLTRVQSLGISRSSASRALAALERAGLVVVSRVPGRNPKVTLLDAPEKFQ
jgi:DNA-binding transcriptional ArsR family regulator